MNPFEYLAQERRNIINVKPEFIKAFMMNYKLMGFISSVPNFQSYKEILGRFASLIIFRLIEQSIFSFARTKPIRALSKSTYEGSISLSSWNPQDNYINFYLSILNDEEIGLKGKRISDNEYFQKQNKRTFLNRSNKIDLFVDGKLLLPLNLLFYYNIKYADIENYVDWSVLTHLRNIIYGVKFQLTGQDNDIMLLTQPVFGYDYKKLFCYIKIPLQFNLSKSNNFDNYSLAIGLHDRIYFKKLIQNIVQRGLYHLNVESGIEMGLDPSNPDISVEGAQKYTTKKFSYYHKLNNKFSYLGVINVKPFKCLIGSCFFNINFNSLFKHDQAYPGFEYGFSLEIIPIGNLI